jgi:hypothetical protein
MKLSGADALRYQQPLPSEAKCIIDTGNQQGNFNSLASTMSLLQSTRRISGTWWIQRQEQTSKIHIS